MSTEQIVVYTAKKIHTMNEGAPTATAIATRGGRIIEVGDLTQMKPWLDAYPHRVDDRFSDKIFMPGFIDPHLHPTLAAVILPSEFITAMEWKLPWGDSAAVRGHDAYLARLAEIHAGMDDPDAPLFSWGYHRIWHGELNRKMLDEIAPDRPVLIWQRSFHEMYLNSAAIKWLKVDEEEAGRHHQIDIEKGHFYEMGKFTLYEKINPFLLEDTRFRGGLKRLKEVVRLGGHTTIGDMGIGMYDLEKEWKLLTDVLDQDDVPFRVAMIPSVQLDGEAEAEMDRLEKMREMGSGRLMFNDHIKMFADGGFFAELMQVLEPGFIDGHEGEWMTSPEQLTDLCRAAWHRGMKIHIHCTGDLGVELALDILDQLQFEKPRFDHRFTLEHFGLANPEQIRRIAALGAQVSANPYYVHELGEAYWKHSIGMERASQMVRLGSLGRHNIPFALHSDLTMAPALPLNNAWVAVNRISETGDVIGPAERISVYQAMKAITIDAAYIIGIENEVGSLRAGKKADITVLDQDPFEVDPMTLKDINVEGVIFEGEVF